MNIKKSRSIFEKNLFEVMLIHTKFGTNGPKDFPFRRKFVHIQIYRHFVEVGLQTLLISILIIRWIERPSTPKTCSRVGRLSPKLKVQNLCPNKDAWLFTQSFYITGYQSFTGAFHQPAHFRIYEFQICLSKVLR